MGRLLKFSFIQSGRIIVLWLGALLLIVHGLNSFLSESVWTMLFGSERPAMFIEDMDPFSAGGLAVVTLALPFAYYLLHSIRLRLERGIVGKGATGEDICLTPEAIERTIAREVKANVPEVAAILDCVAAQGKGSVAVTLKLSVSDRSRVPDVQRRTREVTRLTLEQLIGYSDGSQIRVLVQRIAGLPGATRQLRKGPRRVAKVVAGTPKA